MTLLVFRPSWLNTIDVVGMPQALTLLESRPKFLNFENEPLRVVHLLHPRIAQLVQLPQQGHIRLRVRHSVSDSMLGDRVDGKVVICHSQQ